MNMIAMQTDTSSQYLHASTRRARGRRSGPGHRSGRPVDLGPDSTYLLRWISHQAETYGDLLKSIAGAHQTGGSGRAR